jgi:O-antigen/teichoic acid export membrane protein
MNFSSGRSTFFKQSSWMMLAVTTSGVFMWAVHVPAMRKMPGTEYAMFAALLQVLNLMMIPAVALQTVFAKQTAGALDPDQKRQLRGSVRGLISATSILWAIGFCGIYLLRNQILPSLKITNPAALWITVLTCLPMLWLPILEGVLQGNQNFLWLGCTNLTKGFGRFAAILVTVVVLGGFATAGVSAVFIGTLIASVIALWQSRDCWTGPSDPIRWKPWLGHVLPLTLGLGASQFMFAADMIFVQNVFDDGRAPYAAAGTIARGIVAFTGPLAMVMFPKIVRSAARSESTNLLKQALVATAVLGAGAALGCTLFPSLPFILLKPEFLPIAPLLPWFAWCMWPLTLSNILVSNLLARSRFGVVPWLVVIALAYGVTLLLLRGSFGQTGESLPELKKVVQILGGFNLLTLLVCLGFTRRTTGSD